MFGKRLGLDSNHRLHRQVCVGCDYCSSCRRKAVFAALGAPTTTRQLPTWVGSIRLDGHLPKEESHGQRRRWRGSMMRWLRRCQAPSNWWAIPTTSQAHERRMAEAPTSRPLGERHLRDQGRLHPRQRQHVLGGDPLAPAAGLAVGRFTKGTLGSQAPCRRSGMASGHPSSVPAHRCRRLRTSGMLAAAPLASAVVS